MALHKLNQATARSFHRGKSTLALSMLGVSLFWLSSAEKSSAGAVNAPVLIATLSDRWQESWVDSPVVADIDRDGENEIIASRYNLVIAWHLDNTIVLKVQTEGGRIWSSPIVGDLVPSSPGLEIAVASRNKIYAWTSSGTTLPGFPVTWRDEMRSLAAADIDGDGDLELVAASTTCLTANNRNDFILAVHMDGSVVSGFPPNTTGASGCDGRCYVTGGFDQNIALGDVNGDGKWDIFAGQDNAYLSLHEGNGRAFDSSPIFVHPTKFLGIRFLLDYELAKQGWAPNEETANQAHFTNSAPLIADVDRDGIQDLLILGSVQNASQTDRLRGVVLFRIRTDGTRPDEWIVPYHASDYLSGLWDFPGTNIVAQTNSLAAADLDPNRQGIEMVFAGFDGRIHCVDAHKNQIWQYTYTTDPRVLTPGTAIGDLSGDGMPEIIFTTYSPDLNKSHLFILDDTGGLLHQVPLPDRGAMSVPTLADINGNGTVEIVVNLKDGIDRQRQVLVFEVPGSYTNLLPWPTGRGNYLRNGFYHDQQETQTIPLQEGWNWISFNKVPPDRSLDTVFGEILGRVQQVKSQTRSTLRSNGQWIGDLQNMDGIQSGMMYKVQVTAPCTLTVMGQAVPSAIPILLDGGWNWSAYYPSILLPINEAMSSVSARIQQAKSQIQSALYMNGQWLGDLQQMEPGKGYKILMSGPGTLVYPPLSTWRNQ